MAGPFHERGEAPVGADPVYARSVRPERLLTVP